MAGKEQEHRIFVGGLSWDITERQLEDAFCRYGKILDCQIMLDRDTGRPRGFGFVTYADRRALEEAIREMHGREFGDRVISVNKAQPKMAGEDSAHGYSGDYSSRGRGGGYGGSGDRRSGQDDDCFKCGRPGHWARDCPSGGRGGGGRGMGGRGRFSPPPRFGGGGRGDRFIEDRYDSGRYGGRDRFESKYASRDRYINDRYAPSGGGDRYGGSERYPHNGYGKDIGYDREGGPRGGSDRYGSGGPASRNEGRSYRNRSGPYDRY